MTPAKIPSVTVLAEARRRAEEAAQEAKTSSTEKKTDGATSAAGEAHSQPDPRVGRKDKVLPARFPQEGEDLFTAEEWEVQRLAAFQGQAHEALAVGVRELGAPLEQLAIPRRAAGPRDIVIDLEYCGLCHSDVHTARGEWGSRAVPLVSGHEMVGRVCAVGSEVQSWQVGERVGVGCMVGSCRVCEPCKRQDEQFCIHNAVGTYGTWDEPHSERTQGGYATSIVVPEDFVLRIPEKIGPAHAAPLLFAGITMYAPLEDLRVGPGDKVAVAGIGGLGHMAIKLAAAMGAEVTALTRTQAKAQDARRLGAHDVVLTTDADAMEAARGRFTVLVDAISAPHDVNALLDLLAARGTVVLAGLPADTDGSEMPLVDPRTLVNRGLRLAGTKIGGIEQTQRMLEFCADHGVVPDIEIVTAADVNEAWDRMVAGELHYRGVLDIGSLDSHLNA